VSEDGNKVTKVAETGPEKISVLPRHRSSEVSQQPYQKLDESSELPDVIAADKDPTRSIGNSQQSTPLNSNFGIPIDRAFGPRKALFYSKDYIHKKDWVHVWPNCLPELSKQLMIFVINQNPE
jgi:hypothetical protein